MELISLRYGPLYWTISQSIQFLAPLYKNDIDKLSANQVGQEAGAITCD